MRYEEDSSTKIRFYPMSLCLHANEVKGQPCTCPSTCGCREFMCARISPFVQNEVRITDEKTGAQKGSKMARFDLIPPEALWALAEHYGKGALKYEDRNWEKGLRWGLALAALERHLTQWKMGETFDGETGSHHLIAVIWHAIALFIYQRRNLGTNDVQLKLFNPNDERDTPV